jgi:cytochrome c biogenesis protein CcdA
VDRAAAQQLTLFLAGWLLAAPCMIRLIIRVFQAMEARQPQRPWWKCPWWDVMNIIRRVQLRNTYWLEVIGLLIGFATMFVAVGYAFLTPG